jgi:hypothetical protein
MKTIIFLMSLLTLIIISCEEEDTITAPITPPSNEDEINIEEEINSIQWDKLCERAIYIKKSKYLLLNTNDSTVKIIGKADLGESIKCNVDNTLLTGMRYDNTNNNYNLMATDFDGHQSRLYPALDFDTPYFDWLPDGRILYIKKSGQVYIEGTALNSDIILPFYDITCSPDGNKILVSTSYCDSTFRYYQILEININSGEQDVITLNLKGLASQESRIIQVKYSSTTGRILYILFSWQWLSGYTYTTLYMTTLTTIKEDAYYPNWCPVDGKQLTYSSFKGNPSNTYWRNVYNGSEILVIPGGQMISWFK